jgi:hypothetical protein
VIQHHPVNEGITTTDLAEQDPLGGMIQKE